MLIPYIDASLVALFTLPKRVLPFTQYSFDKSIVIVPPLLTYGVTIFDIEVYSNIEVVSVDAEILNEQSNNVLTVLI